MEQLMMLIAEDEEGNYQPINLACSASEAHEMASCDLRSRLNDLNSGGSPNLCPYIYKLWRQGPGPDGIYRVEWSILAMELAS